MTSWEKYVDVIILFTEDIERSKSFYRDVFGLGPDCHDYDFRFGETLVILPDCSDARGQIAPATVTSREAGSALQMTIAVHDVDAVCADLARRGAELINGPADRPPGRRTARFADPAGHIWEVSQQLTPAQPAAAGGDLSAWEKAEKKIGRLTLFVADLGGARSFYQDVFGCPWSQRTRTSHRSGSRTWPSPCSTFRPHASSLGRPWSPTAWPVRASASRISWTRICATWTQPQPNWPDKACPCSAARQTGHGESARPCSPMLAAASGNSPRMPPTLIKERRNDRRTRGHTFDGANVA